VTGGSGSGNGVGNVEERVREMGRIEETQAWSRKYFTLSNI
jgi:hypothetical protein